MRLTINFLAIIIALTSVSIAQTQVVEKQSGSKTKLEAFTGMTGSIIIKGYSEIGTVGGRGRVNITAMTFKNPNGGKQQAGLAIEIEETAGRTSYQKTSRSFVDYDEIAGLIEGVNYISKSTKNSTILDNFEATYNTKGELSITVFNNSGGEISAAIKSGSIGAAQAFVGLDQLPRFVSFLEKGKATLEAAQ